MKIKVFLDTNILLHSVELKLDIEKILSQLINRDFIILIHPYVEEEIINALLEEGKLGKQANIAMKLISLYESYEDNHEYHGTDASLLLSALRENGIVFTLDKGLRDRCIAEGVTVISSYKKGRMKLFGYID